MDGNLIKRMKMNATIKFCMLGLTGLLIASSCTEEPIGQQSIEGVAPGCVTNATVENIAGGAIITYDLPEDEDLLYVKAVYQLHDGIKADVKAALYKNQLKIEGFGDTNERDVQLYAIDRSGNESTPVPVKVKPLTPPIFTIFKEVTLSADFGGVRILWENKTAANIAITLLSKIDGEYVPVETIYSKRKEGDQSVRGMKSKATDFALVIADRWSNSTDTLFTKLTPLFEKQIPSDRIRAHTMKGDTPDAYGWVLPNLWDNNHGTGFHTSPNETFPQRFTFQFIDGPAKISRFKMVPRAENLWYMHGHVRKFELFGSNNPNPDGSYDGWHSMGKFESIKPSKLPLGQCTNEDIEYCINGEEFSVDSSIPAYQYFRVKMTETWSGGIPCHLMELPMWGCPENYVPSEDE